MKEKQKQNNRPAGEDDSPDPSCLHWTVIIASVAVDDNVGVCEPSSQHARVAVARVVKVGELEYTRKDNRDCVAGRGQHRQPTQESGKILGPIGGF